MAAQLEEIIVSPHRRYVQHIRPDARNQGFGLAHVGAFDHRRWGCADGRGECAAINLLIGQPWQGR